MARQKPPRAASTAAPRPRRARLPRKPPAPKAKAPRATPDRRTLPRRPFRGIERWDDGTYRDVVRWLLTRELRRVRAIQAAAAARVAAIDALEVLHRRLAAMPTLAVPAPMWEGDLEAVRSLRDRLAPTRSAEVVARGHADPAGMLPRWWAMAAEFIAPAELVGAVYEAVDGKRVADPADAARLRRREAGKLAPVMERSLWTYGKVAAGVDRPGDSEGARTAARNTDQALDGFFALVRDPSTAPDATRGLARLLDDIGDAAAAELRESASAFADALLREAVAVASVMSPADAAALARL